MVPGAGLEPARPLGRGILSPLRLPISPPGQSGYLINIKFNKQAEAGIPQIKLSY